MNETIHEVDHTSYLQMPQRPQKFLVSDTTNREMKAQIQTFPIGRKQTYFQRPNEMYWAPSPSNTTKTENHRSTSRLRTSHKKAVNTPLYRYTSVPLRSSIVRYLLSLTFLNHIAGLPIILIFGNQKFDTHSWRIGNLNPAREDV